MVSSVVTKGRGRGLELDGGVAEGIVEESRTVVHRMGGEVLFRLYEC